KLYTSTGTMIEKIGTGEHAFGYNIIGSYVLPKIKADAATYGMVFPTDFTLGFSRVAFIAKKSKRLNAAKLFLDHLLSKRGQDILASKSMLYPARTDAEGEATAAALQKQVGDKLKPIPVSAQVLDALDQTKRLDFVGKWQKALGR
ncbi:MAG: ABC transporter substrate-binding protein, partial [Chloroflexota bacterium]